MGNAFQRRVSSWMARAGIGLLEKSGAFSGFFADWRWSVFDQAAKKGIHMLPVHYYSPVPDLQAVVLDDEKPVFVAADAATLDGALNDLRDLVAAYGEAFAAIGARPAYGAVDRIQEFRYGKAPYSTVEAELLYGLVRAKKPSRIIEIGSGHTTMLVSEAIEAEEGYSPNFECIEPYRPEYLNPLPKGVMTFHDTLLQDIPLEHFEELNEGDVLFIDSSHVVAYGSDTVYELTSILPRLKPGVLVHFHDIFLPYEYPSKWLEESRFFWTEQYMLAVMIQDNPRYEITYPLHQLFRERRSELDVLFPLLGQPGQRPGAYWLTIKGP